MPRIVLSLDEWRAVARELAATHTATAPPGLSERVRELLAQAHDDWDEQAIALELDEEQCRDRPRCPRAAHGHRSRRRAAFGVGRRG